MQIANQRSWGDAVISSYSLERIKTHIGNKTIELFSADRGRSWATAPYLTDSGLHEANVDWLISLQDISSLLDNGQCQYLLVKSREHLNSNNHLVVIDENYVSFELDLSLGADAVWKNSMNQKTRNQVRKAQKYDFTVTFGKEELLRDFYQVISQCWRDLGSPTHSRAFYANILKHFPEHSQLLVIYQDNQAIAGACLLWNNTTLFHPFAANLKTFNRTSVNNLMYWRIIQYAIDKQLALFDMGRSHKQQGTYRYKASWGAREVPLYYHYFLTDPKFMPKPLDHPFYRLATNVWKHLPLAVTQFLGPKLIYKML